MKKYTLIGMILIVLLGGFYFYVVGIKKMQTWVSVRDGEKYTMKMYSDYSVMGNSCQGEDTDGDTYVSCDFRIKNIINEEKILHLQCPIMMKSFTGSVCKEYRLTLPQ